ncbi:hypothetical protein OV208_15345 [Corallococcus sp. bb12-1]|uniref:hypothetical protein n=1 Tax=Corallococcus sp. bb12-1 TaxID=2996784 RepID=UPI00226D8923|nr:hypothetical protein [Corallococcus sp. bb12-1]MCY1042699.1 hypothetical protein [Corallococcus sp. bb12-1]
MPVSLSIRALPREVATILEAARAGGIPPGRLVEHAAVDGAGWIGQFVAPLRAPEVLTQSLMVEMGEREYALAMDSARRMTVPRDRYLVLATLRYIRALQESYQSNSAWRAIRVPAC